MTIDVSDLITVPEATRIIGTYETRVRRLIYAGTIRSIRIGGRLLVYRSSAEEYAAKMQADEAKDEGADNA